MRLVAALLLFTAVSSSAQTPTPPAASDTILVTASALPETLESAPASATVVTKEEIAERAARDIADVLREVPGLTISRTGSPGRATSLFTRGSNSTHTLVLWNGIEINNPYFAGYDWGRFSTAGVEQIEIVRGPYSALYGSDAVAGVVNVLTTPTRSGVQIGLEAGGNGLRNGSLGLAHVAGESAFAAMFEKRDDDGFAPNDDFSQNSANLSWRWTGSNRLSLGLTGRYTSYDLGIPTNVDAAGSALVPSVQRRESGSERQIALPLQQTLGGFSYELTLSESRRDDDFADPDDPFGFVESATGSTSRRARLITRTTTRGGTIVAGAEYERARVSSSSNFGAALSDDRRTEKSLFIEDRVSRDFGTSRLEVSAGVRRDDYETFGAETSPRLSAAWIAGSNKFRAAYGEAFRAPSIGELYFPFSGNPSLEAETSRSVEAGYDRALGAGGLFSATLFRGRYRNLIVFDNRTFAFQNAGSAESHGVELGLTAHWTEALRATASYTFLDTEQDASGESLVRRPRHSGSLAMTWRSGSVDTNVVILHSGSRGDILPVFPYSRVTNEAYTTVGANVQLHLTHISPWVKVENLTNHQYEEVLGYPSPSRRISVGVRYVR